MGCPILVLNEGRYFVGQKAQDATLLYGFSFPDRSVNMDASDGAEMITIYQIPPESDWKGIPFEKISIDDIRLIFEALNPTQLEALSTIIDITRSSPVLSDEYRSALDKIFSIVNF